MKDHPPPVSQLRPSTPPAVDRVVQTCIAKNPADRYQNAHDLWLNLRWISDDGSSTGPLTPALVRTTRRERWLWIAAALALTVLGGFAGLRLRPAQQAAHTVTRFQYSLPVGQDMNNTSRHVLAISPDGTKLAYVANKRLYLRSMDKLEAEPVRGTNEDPMEPIFSPDSKSLAYFARSDRSDASVGGWMLRKVAVAGGVPATLGLVADAPYGASWRNGTIVFAINTAREAGIEAISETGGALRTLVTVDPNKEQVAQPQLLADGKHLLFVSVPRGSKEGESQIVVQTPGKEDRRTVVYHGTDPRVLPTGQLVYIFDRTLLAVPFNTNLLTVTGPAVPVLDRVAETTATLAGQFAISSEGTLAFDPRPPSEKSQRKLVWIERNGHEQPIPATPRVHGNPRHFTRRHQDRCQLQ